MNSMENAMTRLVLEQPFWAMLALRLKVVVDTTIDTLATDGVYLKYNPAFFDPLPGPEQMGCVAHEVDHCALLHMSRRGDRDHAEWNEACDFVVNLDIIKSGMVLPDGCLVDYQYDGMSAEQVYSLRKKQKQDGNAPKPGRDIGHVDDAPTFQPGEGGTEEISNVEADWKIAVEQATMLGKKAGHLPAGIEVSIERSNEAGQDWRTVVARYLEAKGDYSWTSPNRKFAWQGVYLPGSVVNKIPHVVFIVDTSASTRLILKTCEAEMRAILTAGEWPERVTIIHCDAKVHACEDIADESQFEFRPKGGGGTRLKPAFEHIEEEGMEPTVVFCLTDLEIDSYDLGQMDLPKYDTVWIAPDYNRTLEGPFGETVHVPVI